MAQEINIIFGAVSVGGTADAITAVYSPVLSALTNRRTLSFKAAANNTGAATFSPDGLTVRSITKRGGNALIAGDILQNAVYIIQYDLTNTRWELLNPSTDNNTVPTLAQVLNSGNLVPDGIPITSVDGAVHQDFGSGLYYGLTTDGGVYATPFIYLQPGSEASLGYDSTKGFQAQSAQTNVKHSSQINLDSPNINLPNETASRYLYLDASKNIDTKTNAQVLSDIGAQPLDADLTTIAGLSPTNDDMMQYKAGAWANRTLAQVRADLGDYFSIPFMSNPLSPADSTTYYFGLGRIAPTTTSTSHDFNVGFAFTIVGVVIDCTLNSTSGTAENSVLQIRNITQATSSSVGNFQTNGSATTEITTTFTGLNISVAAGDFIALQWDAPAWVTNPVGVITNGFIICKRI